MYNNQKMQDFGFALPFMSEFPNMISLAAQRPPSPKKTIVVEKDSQQQSFQPDNHYMKRLGIKSNRNKIIVGSWSGHQNQIYLDFMLKNKNDFLTEKSRRTSKIFYRLSKILKKRTPDQCRSHHQKLQMKFKDDLNAIIQEVYKKVQRSIAQKFVNTYHQLFPNYLSTQIQNKAQSRTSIKETKQKEPIQKMQEGKWYKLTYKSNRVKITLKTAALQGWEQN